LELGAGNLMVSDGEATWTYRPSTKLYTKITAAQGPDGVAANLAVLDVMGFFEDAKSAKTVRSETINLDGRDFDCWVITSNVKIPSQARDGRNSFGLSHDNLDPIRNSSRRTGSHHYSVTVAPAAGAALWSTSRN
jgi:hypothetical protein